MFPLPLGEGLGEGRIAPLRYFTIDRETELPLMPAAFAQVLDRRQLRNCFGQFCLRLGVVYI